MTSLRLIRFGAFEVDLRAGELYRQGRKVKLQDQPFQLLTLLLEHPGEVVTREELRSRIWSGDTFVDFDQGLNKAILKIREALGDDADNPRFVETLPRRGYRFIAPLEKVNGTPPPLVATVPTGVVSKPSVPSGNGECLSAATPPPAIVMPRVDTAVAVEPVRGTTITAPVQARSQAMWRFAVVAAVFVIAVGGTAFLLRPPLPPPTILGYRQLTHDGRPIWDVLATDGARVYFSEFLPAGGYSLAYVSAAGGETVHIPTSLREAELEGISPDGTELLVTDRSIVSGGESPIYVVAAVGGATRRLGNAMGHCGSWLADGRVIFEKGSDIYLVNRDGSEPHKVVTASSPPDWPRSSPDGKLIRFESGDGIWEVGADGTNLHPLLPGWNRPASEVTGSWTPDGKYFLFQSGKGGTNNIWAIREGGSAFYKVNHEPMQVITGPVGTYSPLPSPDGKKLFVISSMTRWKLVRYDARSRKFVPYLNGISAANVDFSKDGQWTAYVQYPEQTLWRSKIDGSDKVQLTFPPLKAGLLRWSPDGTQIAFVGITPDGNWQAYLVAADGSGTPQLIPTIPGEAGEMDPGWSPDGTSLVFSGVPSSITGKSNPAAIHIMDVRTRKVTTLPDSKGLFSPRWSPNGRYIAAVPYERDGLVVYDLSAGKWSDLGVRLSPFYPQWSRDGQAVYFFSFPKGRPKAIFRVRLSDHRMEQVAGLEHFHQAWPPGYWMGIAPDNSPLMVEDDSTQEIFALDVKLP